MTVHELAKRIDLPKEAAAQTLQALERLSPDVLAAADRLLTEPHADALKVVTPLLGDDSLGFAMLAAMLHAALLTHERYAEQGIGEDIFTATMGCFSRYVREYGVSYGHYGFDRGFWTVHMLRCELFRIGTLEFEIGPGENLLHLHIPSDASLAAPCLRDSCERGRAFLARFRPAYAHSPIECESWLLSPSLSALLPQDSRIAAFRRSFTLLEELPNDRDFLEWVYKLRPNQRDGLTYDDLPESTALQRSMKAFLQKGGVVGAAVGKLADEPFRD